MILGSRNGFTVGRWKNPYVTDGLVAMWDGEWNAGDGKHDLNATQFKSIVGSATLPITANDAVGPNYVQYNGSSRTDLTVKEDAYSIELVFDAVQWEQRATAWILDRYQSNGTWQDSFFGEQANGPSLTDYQFLSQGTCRLFLNSSSSITIPTAGPGIVTIGFYDNSGSVRAYYKGAYYSAKSLSTSRSRYFGLETYRAMMMRVYQLRVYNRALSAAEIAANYAVDKARFNLP